jgi:hypothetical protein
MKRTTKTNKQALTKPYAVFVAGDVAEPAFLAGHDDLASAERHREECWIAPGTARTARPPPPTCGSETRKPTS